MVYTFPNNVIAWAFRVLLAAILSLCIGTIWFDTRTDSRVFHFFQLSHLSLWKAKSSKERISSRQQEQMHVNDRLGFHYLMMGLGIWPSILLDLSDAWSEKAPVTRDVSDGLYSKANYIFCKVRHIFARILECEKAFQRMIHVSLPFSCRCFTALRQPLVCFWPISFPHTPCLGFRALKERTLSFYT